MLADEPSFVAWKVLLTLIPYPLRRSVGSTHADSSKSGFQPTFRPAAPTHSFPLGTGQHVFQPLSIEYLARAAYVAGPELW